MSPDLAKLVARLKQSEGWSPTLYVDTTGNLTIGYGYNLARLALPTGVTHRDIRLYPVNGISETIGEALMLGHLTKVIEDLQFALPWLGELDDVRQRVLVDMAYNLGVPGLLRWPIFLGQVRRHEYLAASGNMRATTWAQQVGKRAQVLADMMATGKDPA